MSKADDVTIEQQWSRVVVLLNDDENDHADEVRALADAMLRRLRVGGDLPSNCVIRPGLTRQGFILLLCLIRD